MIEKKIKFLLVALGVILTISFISWSGAGSFADADKDGVADPIDNCPTQSNPIQSDFDDDKLGDECDPDDDNDKIVDAIDAFDNDKSEWADFDFDNIGKSTDPDDDNDGILDVNDDDPTLIIEDMTLQYLQDIQDCATINDDTSRLLCYTQFFGEVAKNEENNSNALALSIALSKLGAIDDCHFVSHEIGHISFVENPNVLENLMDADGTMCRGGYFHGVLASYFHEVGEKGESFPDYKTICNDLIGSSNYQDCVHGLGHGLVHFFGDDLKSSVELCNDMSFYQDILCTKGVMMQYTDNVLTRQGISKDVISNLCNESELNGLDYQECSMSIGTTLAFFTNHNLNEGKSSCELIDDKNTQKLCLDGLRLEIEDSQKYEKTPLTLEMREKFQPQQVEGSSKIIDIRSPAVISDFEFNPIVGIISFSIDRPQYVTMYIPSEFVAPKMVVTVNGKIPSQLDAENNVLGEDIAMIRFVPNNSGVVMITPLS